MRRQEQNYFWTPEWQAEEKKVEEEKQMGKVRFFSSPEELIEDLHLPSPSKREREEEASARRVKPCPTLKG